MAPVTSSDCTTDTIPPHCHALYRTYKTGTSELVGYLVSIGAKDGDGPSPTRIPVRRFLELARELAAKAVKPPERIRRIFCAVIVNRRKITQHYEITQQPSQKAVVEATSRHKFFNQMLALAYDVLFSSLPSPSRRAAKKAKAAARISRASDSDSEVVSTNRFEVLSDILEKEPAFEPSAFISDEDEQLSAADFSAIEDDPIEAAVAIHAYLTEVEGVISACKDTWKRTAEGSTPLPLAGWITMLAQEIIRHVADAQDARLDGYAAYISQYIITRYNVMQEQGVNTSSDFHCGPADAVYDFHSLTYGTGLMWPFEALRSCRAEKLSDEGYMSGTEEESLAEYLLTQEEEEQAEHEFVQQVSSRVKPTDGIPLANLHHSRNMALVDLLVRDVRKASLRYQRRLQPDHTIPLAAEIRRFFTGPGEATPSSLIFGIHLFAETSKSFLRPGPTAAPKENLRSHALDFAREVAVVVTDLRNLTASDRAYAGLFTVQTFQIMDEFLDLFEKFSSKSRADPYHESPWVAGSHMSVILAAAQRLGISLLNQGGVFGSLLHLYNLIHQVGVQCQMIPVLDQLCNTFSSQVFLRKTRPTNRFSITHEVFLGAELVRPRGGPCKLVPEAHSKGKYEPFSVNARIKAEDMCMFSRQLEVDGMCDDELWTKVADELVATNGGRKMRRGSKAKDRLFQQFPLPEVLGVAARVVAAEFDDSNDSLAPIASLNAFKVLTLCLRTWKRITDKYEVGGEVPIPLARDMNDMKNHGGIPGHIAIGRALHGLTAADVDVQMSLDARQKSALKDHGALLLMRDAILEVWGELGLKDLLWRCASGLDAESE
ncbi:hypothetical protein K458DRAFT_395783 [Lentithecium fluviatile CBS 122367]|uniref:DUF6604 domain-containing protein n=1 Tax=Lentithecium fluviatile CBS 122367 TaxID=1168545 RepID=A0A6G1IID6_9PLEO|nr:hypothetical protein K458DRAFT_395783 [Lentithecium fluviatile CBS 122367]